MYQAQFKLKVELRLELELFQEGVFSTFAVGWGWVVLEVDIFPKNILGLGPHVPNFCMSAQSLSLLKSTF